MNIFVTGATGFVGSYFVRLAIQRNHRVLALRRSVTSRARIALPREPEWISKGMEELSDADFVGIDTCVRVVSRHDPKLYEIPGKLRTSSTLQSPIAAGENHALAWCDLGCTTVCVG